MEVMLEKEITNELNHHFSSFVLTGKQEEARTVLIILSYAKSKHWFSKDYYQFWLLRFLTVKDGAGCFVLSNRHFLKDVCGLTLMAVGEFVRNAISGLLGLSDSRIVPMLDCAIEGGAIFNDAWISSISSSLALDETYIKRNRENKFGVLDDELDKKDDESFSKI